MQRVVRSALLAALTIAGLTACGDKVNVVGPSSSTVTGVTVTPPSATMQIGDKVQFAASVSGGASDHTVTWTSSNTAVVTVDQTGLATAVSAGSASVVATSKADPTQSGAAAVTVGAGGIPTITVSTINQTTCQPNGVCNSVPANLQNVQGQIDVTFNVDPGSQKLAEVDLIMNCTGPGNSGTDTVVARQTVSSSSIAAEASTAPITLSFNTATFNSTNGAVAFKNGSCTIKGKAVTTSGTQTVNTVSATQALVLNNVDIIVISPAITTTPTAPQLQTATDQNGLLWNAGAVNVTAVPVIFTASRTIVSGAISLVNGNHLQQLGQNQTPVNFNNAFATISGITPASGLLTATFPNSTTAPGGVGGATVDTVVVTVTTVDNSGNPGPTLTSPATPGNFIRLDNLAPPNVGGIVVNFISQNATNNWTGANFAFTQAAGFITSIPTATTTDNNGVDRVTETPQFSTQAAPTTWTNITTTAAIGESSSANAYNFRFNVCDALMNCAAAPPTSATGDKFGVDVTPPRITNVQGPQNLEIVGITQNFANGTFLTGTLTDSSATGSNITGSGFGATPLLVAETQLAPSGASGQISTCVIGTPGAADANGNTACKAAAQEPNSPGAAVVAHGNGMYTLTYQAIDQAGNASPAVTIMFYLDQSAPAVSNANITIPGTIAQNTPFSATATDNMDVASANGGLQYAGFEFFEPGGASPAGVPFDNTLTRSSTITVTLSTFFQSLASMPGLTNHGKPVAINLRALDAANNLSLPQPVGIPAANVGGTGLTPYTLGTGNSNSMQNFVLAPASPTTVSAGGVTASTPTSTTLTGVVTAANQQVNTPFTSVCFFYQNTSGTEGGLSNVVNGGAAGELVLIACTTTPPADVTTGSTRTFTYQMPWTPGAKFPAGNVNTWAVGINAATDGAITAASVVTIVP